MGTSRESSNMKSIMKSIIHQIERIFNKKGEEGEGKEVDEVERVEELREAFVERLNKASSQLKENQRLIIILDSIDQLSKGDYQLDWLIADGLPLNVKMIYSLIPDYPSADQYSILCKLKRKLTYTKSNYLKKDEFDINEAKGLIGKWLSDEKIKRTLQPTQWNMLDTVLSRTNTIYPLHVKILFDVVSKWSSYDRFDKDALGGCVTTKDTIKYLFTKYESLYGNVLFSHCIFYLTLFEYNGISEAELEDILSIDDAVLTECFQYHHPPVRRFQVALWLKIKYEIRDYLTQKDTDGVQVCAWFHRSFIEASQDHCQEYFVKSKINKDELLRNVIDYFTEKWNQVKSDGSKGEEKPFMYKKSENHPEPEFKQIKERLEKKFKKTGNADEYLAFRGTKAQKIKTEKRIEESGREGKGRMVSYNKRKLNELLNVILMLNDDLVKVDLLKRHVYLNYEFMHAKCELKDLDLIFDGIDATMELGRRNDGNQLNELIEVCDVYKTIYPIIYTHPDLLYIELLSRLKSRSEYVLQFSRVILTTKSFVKEKAVKDLFITASDSCIVNFCLQHEGPLFFVHTWNWSKKHSTINLVDSRNSRLMKSQNLHRQIGDHLQIVIKSGNKTIKNVNDAQFYLFYHSPDSVYFGDFVSSKQIFESEEGEEGGIKTILLLHSNYLAVFMSESMILVDIEKGERKSGFERREDRDEIEMIESTIPKQKVFESDYLDGVEDGITIIVGFKLRKTIRIYQFDRKRESNKISLISQLDSIKYDYFGFYQSISIDQLWRESLLIDPTFLIDNVKRGKLNEGELDQVLFATK